jgi:hypothetical protein
MLQLNDDLCRSAHAGVQQSEIASGRAIETTS